MIHKTNIQSAGGSSESSRGVHRGLEQPAKREERGGEKGLANVTRESHRDSASQNDTTVRSEKTASTPDRLIWRAGKKNDRRTGGLTLE